MTHFSPGDKYYGKIQEEGKVCQPFPVAARNQGMLGESGSQVCSGVFNRHLSHLRLNREVRKRASNMDGKCH